MNDLDNVLKAKKTLEIALAETDLQITKLRLDAAKAFETWIEKHCGDEIKRLDSNISSSQDLTSVVNDEYFHRYVHFDASKLVDVKDKFMIRLLKDYLREHCCIELDLENGVATASEGPCIYINYDGDVLDQNSGKWIISKKDYETSEERNRLIEEYMHKSGYFPSVIETDYYGNAHYVNTQKKD